MTMGVSNYFLLIQAISRLSLGIGEVNNFYLQLAKADCHQANFGWLYMFKNILNLQNHRSLIYHYLRNVNRDTPGFPTNQATTSWSTRTQVRLLHFSVQQQPLRKQTETNQTEGNRKAAALLWFWKLHTFDEHASEHHTDFPSHQASFSLGCLWWFPREPLTGLCGNSLLMTRHHFQLGSTQHHLPFPRTAGPLLRFSAALLKRNHLGVQTIHWQGTTAK